MAEIHHGDNEGKESAKNAPRKKSKLSSLKLFAGVAAIMGATSAGCAAELQTPKQEMELKHYGPEEVKLRKALGTLEQKHHDVEELLELLTRKPGPRFKGEKEAMQAEAVKGCNEIIHKAEELLKSTTNEDYLKFINWRLEYAKDTLKQLETLE